MSNVHVPKIFLTLLVLCVAASMLQAQAPPASPVTSDHASVTVTYLKGTGPGAVVPVKFTAAGATVFVVDPTTVPFWLALQDSATPPNPVMGGTAVPAPGLTINFVANAVPATLNAGGYNGSVHVKVSGFQDLVIPIVLVVSDPASSLTVTDVNGPVNLGNGETVHWTPGTAFTLTNTVLTMVSSDAPLAFTVATSVTAPAAPANWISVNHASGIAYTYGTPITVSFLSDVLYNAAVGANLTGTVTVTPTGGAPIAVNFTIVIDEPPAAITRIFPTQTPVQSAHTIQVVVTGSGFGTTGGYNGHPTVVSIKYGPNPQTTAVLGTVGGAVAIPNQNTLVLTIPINDGATPPVAILSAANTLTISVTNGLNAEVAATTTIAVTASPIIYTVTDAASLVEAVPGGNPTFAPYELITLFGDNFGPTAGAAPVQGTLDTVDRYSSALATNGHNLTVTFYKADGVTSIANAYLLYATNNQINALVPSGVVGNATVQIVAAWNALTSAPFTAAIAAEDPGVFTTTSSGEGQGAILLSDYSLNSASNPGLAGKSTVLIYVTGLGAPNSTGANSNATTSKFPTTCVSPANYMATINALPANPGWTTVDGAVIQSSQLKTNVLPPCMATANAVTVSIGGQPATVSYAGWVDDSVAGLYQINALVPAKANPSVSNPPAVSTVPVVVTIGGVSSQPGVTMSVK